MELNYIVLAHKNPYQLFRLINKLNAPWTRFYVHIDKQVEIEPFKKDLYHLNNVQFLEKKDRRAGIWGDIGIVEATINALRLIVNQEKTGYTILLTGQDYPLHSNSEIHDFFKANNGLNFITSNQIPNKIWDREGMPRINRYKINKSNRRGHILLLPSIYDKEFYSRETLGKLNFLRKTGKFRELKTILTKRRFPENLIPYGGSVYWALPMDTIKIILSYIDQNTDYLKYHKYTLCADEIFFQSIIMKIISDENLIRPSLTYTNWKRKIGPLPVTFKEEDIDELYKASVDHLFARKFDYNIDRKILDRLDLELLNN